jgi:hypothetical protein
MHATTTIYVIELQKLPRRLSATRASATISSNNGVNEVPHILSLVGKLLVGSPWVRQGEGVVPTQYAVFTEVRNSAPHRVSVVKVVPLFVFCGDGGYVGQCEKLRFGCFTQGALPTVQLYKFCAARVPHLFLVSAPLLCVFGVVRRIVYLAVLRPSSADFRYLAVFSVSGGKPFFVVFFVLLYAGFTFFLVPVRISAVLVKLGKGFEFLALAAYFHSVLLKQQKRLYHFLTNLSIVVSCKQEAARLRAERKARRAVR